MVIKKVKNGLKNPFFIVYIKYILNIYPNKNMHIFVIEPLLTWHETIEIRTTNLESFWQCPLKYRKAEQDWNSEAFDFWKVVHNAVQAYLFSPGTVDEILEFVCKYREDYCDKVRSYINLAKYNILENWYTPIVNEIEWKMEIHFWKYKFLISGTADLVLKKKWLKWYIIWDIKTSKSEWKEWVLTKKLQKFVYTYMVWQKVWFDNIIWFEYFVFTKHVHPRFQSLWTYGVTKEQVEDIIRSILTAYVYSLEHDDWVATKNDYCFFCSLNKKKQCPLYWWVDFNL